MTDFDRLRDRILGRLEETKPLYYEDAADDLLPVVREAVAAELYEAAALTAQEPTPRDAAEWRARILARAARWRADR